MKKILISVVFLSIVSCSAVFAGMFGADDGIAEGAAQFMEIGISAKAVAMGKAFSANADSASGFYYNPGGLGFSRAIEVSNTSCSLGLDRSLNFISITYPIILRLNDDFSFSFDDFEQEKKIILLEPKQFTQYTISAAMLDFGVDNIERRDLWGNTNGNFKDKENLYILGFGYRAYNNLSVGVNIKKLSQNLDTAKAESLGGDFGAIYTHTGTRLSFALVLKDIASKLKWKVDDEILNITYKYKETIPMKIVVGSSYTSKNKKGVISLDLNKTQYRTVYANIGGEYRFGKLFALRAGINRSSPAFGWGIQFPVTNVRLLNISIDYAYQHDIDELSSSHYMSVQILIDQSHKMQD